jgi:hypothetical protein
MSSSTSKDEAMDYKLASLQTDLITNQTGVGIHAQGREGQYASVSLTFEAAPGHYSKRQLLEKTKRLLQEVSTFLDREIAGSP